MRDGIRLRSLAKSFGSTVVLEGMDLSVADGTLLAVLGPSGSGKTTLLRLVAGFERPDSGVIELAGETVDGPGRYLPPERRRIGYVAQEGALFPHLSVAGNVSFGLRRDEKKAGRVGELLDLVGMTGLERRYPHELSGGQQQRVALARALAPRPRLVLLDEPFSALDASLRASVRSEVVAILRAEKVTSLLVTHDQEEALSTADVVGVLGDGRIRQLGRPDELYASPLDSKLARFVGEANLVSGVAHSGRAETPLGTVAVPVELEGTVTVLLRPEQIRLTGSADGKAHGKVVGHEYYGHDSLVAVQMDGRSEPLKVRVGGTLALRIGDTVALEASGTTVAWPAAPREVSS